MAVIFKLKRLMEIKGVSSQALQDSHGIRPATLSAIRTNKIKQLPVELIDKICSALDCQPNDWIEHIHNTEGE